MEAAPARGTAPARTDSTSPRRPWLAVGALLGMPLALVIFLVEGVVTDRFRFEITMITIPAAMLTVVAALAFAVIRAPRVGGATALVAALGWAAVMMWALYDQATASTFASGGRVADAVMEVAQIGLAGLVVFGVLRARR